MVISICAPTGFTVFLIISGFRTTCWARRRRFLHIWWDQHLATDQRRGTTYCFVWGERRRKHIERSSERERERAREAEIRLTNELVIHRHSRHRRLERERRSPPDQSPIIPSGDTRRRGDGLICIYKAIVTHAYSVPLTLFVIPQT